MSEVVGLSEVVGVLREIAESLAVIAGALRDSGGDGGGPNYQRRLADYPAFDWGSIDAEVVASDDAGATVVRWRGSEFQRRRHADYDASLWFSYYTGKRDEDGNKIYSRLITFTDRARVVKSLPDEITERLPAATAPQARKPAAVAQAVKRLRVAKRDAQAPPEEGEEDAGALADAAGQQEFWARFHALKNEGRLPDAEAVRKDPVVVAAIKTGDYTAAMKFILGKMRI